MPRYRLLQYRTTIDTYELEVDADDKEEAYHKASRGAEDASSRIDTTFEDTLSDLVEEMTD